MLKLFFQFLKDIYRNRELILQLTIRDFKSRYLGSYLGLLWAFIQPAMTLLVLWFVFEIGFKSTPVDDFPFILWLMAGIIPWFFIADTLQSGTSAIVDNSYLVKKVVFRVSMLPVVKLLSALTIHIFFVLIIFISFIAYQRPPGIYSVQVFYYGFAAAVLMLGVTWLTSALMVFFRDISQIVMIVVQFGFWVTPIFWSLEMIPERYRIFFQLNPFYYITKGFRDCFINQHWFWESPLHSLYFWLIVSFIFVLGATVFVKLRPHFADVL